jgi:anti-anti-sigma factor
MERLTVEKVGPGMFRLHGELDLARAADLDTILEEEALQGGDMTLDLSEVEFLDSSAMGVLARVARTLEGKGRLILRSPSRAVRLALETSQLDTRDNIEVLD